MFVEDLEILEINHKNKLYGWANKNGKQLEFETINEQIENGRRLFTIAAVINGKLIAQGKAFNKKDASQIAAQLAVEKLGIVNSDSPSDVAWKPKWRYELIWQYDDEESAFWYVLEIIPINVSVKVRLRYFPQLL